MSASTPTTRSWRDAGSGAVRRLPSGRYQDRLLTDDRSMVPAPHTFATKREAQGGSPETRLSPTASVVCGSTRAPPTP